MSRFSCETCDKKFNRTNVFRQHSEKCAARKCKDEDVPMEENTPPDETKPEAEVVDQIANMGEEVGFYDDVMSTDDEEAIVIRPLPTERSLSSLRRNTRRPQKYRPEEESKTVATRPRAKRKPGRPRKVDRSAVVREEEMEASGEDAPAASASDVTAAVASQTTTLASDAVSTVTSAESDVTASSTASFAANGSQASVVTPQSLPIALTTPAGCDVTPGGLSLNLSMERAFSLLERDGLTYLVDTATQQVLAQVANRQ